MPIVVNCPACGLACTIADQWIGHPMACPCCGYGLNETVGGFYQEQQSPGGQGQFLKNPVWLVAAAGGAVALASVLLILISSLFRHSPEPLAENPAPAALPQPNWPPAASPAAPPNINVQPAIQPASAPTVKPDISPGPVRSNPSGSETVKGGGTAPKMKGWKAAPGGRIGGPNEEAPPVPAEWQSAVDPPAEPIIFDATRKYHIAFPGEGHETRLVRPDVASPFIALGSGRNANHDWDLWNLVEVKRIASVKQVMMGDRQYALSPDGRYLASTESFKNLIYIWDLIGRESAGIIELESERSSTHAIAFPSATQLLYVGEARGSSQAEMTIWKMPDGIPERTVKLPQSSGQDAFGISPGGKYLAMITRGSPPALRIYELETGQVRGATFVPQSERGFHEFTALVYSPDGKELAALGGNFGKKRLLCWDMETGELATEFELKESFGDKLDGGNRYTGRKLEWFPDRQRWLVSGQVIVDRSAQGAVLRLPNETGMHTAEQRILLDNENLLVGMGGSRNRALTGYKIEQKQVARGIENAERGGREIDQQLPPLTPPDMSAVQELSGFADSWQAKPDPAPQPAGKLLPRPLDLKDGTGKIFFARADVGKVLLDCTSSPPINLNSRRGAFPIVQPGQVHRLCLYDLIKGQHLKTTPLAYDAETVAFSPDGNRVAVRLSEGQDRIDVFHLPTEKHVAGWRPSPDDKEAGDRFPSSFSNHRERIEAAEFIDADHLITKGQGEKLVLWKLPECQAVWRTKASHFQLTPNHKYVVLSNHNSVTLVDALTGEPQGQLEAKGSILALAVDAKGKQLATLSIDAADSVLECFSLEDGKQTQAFTLPVSGQTLQWCGDEHLLFGQRLLVSLRRGMVIWAYDSGGGHQANETPDGRFWYTAMRGGVGGMNCSLNAISLPDPLASMKLASLGPRRDLAVGLGTSLSLKLNLPSISDRPNFADEVRRSLIQKFAAHQVTVVEGQPVVLELSYASSPTGQTIVYSQGAFSVFRKPSKEATQMPEMKVECRATITLDGKTLWERKSATTTPTGSFKIPAGESIETHMNKILWRNAGAFFENLAVPTEVLASGKNEGYGVSVLSRGGSIPKDESVKGFLPGQ